jgi:hypothetical protein
MAKYQFHPKEFTQLRYNVEKIPEGTTVLQFFKELAKIREFKASAGEAIDNDKVNRYVILMYDSKSPYRSKYHDVLKRKIEIVHDLAFKTLDDGSFESPVEDMLRGKNEIVNKKIVQFVRMHRSFKYSYLVAIESSYYNLMLEIIGGDTKKLSVAKELRDDLESSLLELLNMDNNPYMKDDMLRYIEEERLALRPEDIAKKIQNGEPPITKKSKI